MFPISHSGFQNPSGRAACMTTTKPPLRVGTGITDRVTLECSSVQAEGVRVGLIDSGRPGSVEAWVSDRLTWRVVRCLSLGRPSLVQPALTPRVSLSVGAGSSHGGTCLGFPSVCLCLSVSLCLSLSLFVSVSLFLP